MGLREDIKHGYKVGDNIIHSPPAGKGNSLGSGIVEAIRNAFGYEQLLVQFSESRDKRWLDWRVLASAYPIELRMINGICGKYEIIQNEHGSEFSKGLKIWDANTGAFGRLDIDPLPHQLDVAKKLFPLPSTLALADDVGLGKTIEVGLIIHAFVAVTAVGEY